MVRTAQPPASHVRAIRRPIGLTPKGGGRSSRPNHALTCVVTVSGAVRSGRVRRSSSEPLALSLFPGANPLGGISNVVGVFQTLSSRARLGLPRRTPPVGFVRRGPLRSGSAGSHSASSLHGGRFEPELSPGPDAPASRPRPSREIAAPLPHCRRRRPSTASSGR